MPTANALNGLAVLAPIAAEIATKMQTDAEFAQKRMSQIAAFKSALRERIQATTAQESSAPSVQIATTTTRDRGAA